MAGSVSALVAQVNRVNKGIGNPQRFDVDMNVLERSLADEALRLLQVITLESGDPMAIQRHTELAIARDRDPVGYVAPTIDQVVTALALYGDSKRFPKVAANVAPPPLPASANAPDFVTAYVKANPVPIPWDGWMYTGAIALGLAGAILAARGAKKLAARRRAG